MGWRLISGRPYYYRPRRQGGRVKSDYIPVSVAPLVAQLDAHERERKEMETYLERERRREDRELDAQVEQAVAALRMLARAELLAEGFHTHKRQWRQRRD